MKKIRFVTSREAINASGIKKLPEIKFEPIIKLKIPAVTPKNICLLRSDGEVIGSGSITIEKKRIVGLRRTIKIVFGEKFPEDAMVKMALEIIKVIIE